MVTEEQDPPQYVTGRARYFMVMGIDVAVRTADLGLQQAFSATEHIVPPGAGLPPHALPTATLLMVLQGRVWLEAGTSRVLLSDSETAYVPPQTFYGYSNDGQSEARLMLIAFGGPDYEAFLADVARDPRRVPNAAARHQIAVASSPSANGRSWLP